MLLEAFFLTEGLCQYMIKTTQRAVKCGPMCDFFPGGLIMFREMHRAKQAISREECIRLLKIETRGVLSVIGDDGCT